MDPSYNPYAAPAARPGFTEEPPSGAIGYLSLRTLTIVLTIAIPLTSLMQLVSVTLPMPPTTFAALSGIDSLVALTGMTSFLFWIHRAAKNLRALNREGMEFSPARAVYGFFIPFMNLVLPAQAMGEVWRASNPEYPHDPIGWYASYPQPMVKVWWGAWVLSGLMSVAASQWPSTEMTIAAQIGRVISAIFCLILVHQIDRRQATLASRLR